MISQASNLLHDPMKPYISNEKTTTEATVKYQLNGTVISPHSRIAIVNGIPSQVGDSVDGAKILAIESNAIWIQTKRGKHTVTLSSESYKIKKEPSTFKITRFTTKKESLNIAIHSDNKKNKVNQYGPVNSGENLFTIAKNNKPDDVSINQMMLLIYDINPKAFKNNINALYAGAILKLPNAIPSINEHLSSIDERVAQQHADWKSKHAHHSSNNTAQSQPSSVQMKNTLVSQYGPIDKGQTLFSIAEKLSNHGISINQMMMAIFNHNPQAFGGNINVLHAGATLTIPNNQVVKYHSATIVSKQVTEQRNTWKNGSWRSTEKRMKTAASNIKLPFTVDRYSSY